MKKTTRREFIKRSGFTMLTVGVGAQAFPRYVQMAASSSLTRAAALSQNDRILVVIQLAGGNDGLDTVIPMSGALNGIYRDHRPTLAVPEAGILPIGRDAAGNQLGFHPQLSRLRTLFNQGRVAVIQSVGYDNPNRSHFRSMDIWHTANPDRVETFGWLGDTLDVTAPANDNPLLAVAITGDRLPLSLAARRTPVPVVASIEDYRLRATNRLYPRDELDRVQTLLALNREAAPERALYEKIRLTALDAYSSSETLQERADRNYQNDPNIVYPSDNPLAGAMKQAAQIIASDLGTKILYVMLDGFDTHQGQLDRAVNHPLLLRYLDEAVWAFYQDLRRLGRDEQVLMMTWSEFGRKLPENGNHGTDHGASAPQFVIGTNVNGLNPLDSTGIFGEHPSLTNLYSEDDTKHAIDFRSIYATILERWLDVRSREILGGSFEVMDFVL
jgi:uncharacterized protein (DUF1501 family)